MVSPDGGITEVGYDANGNTAAVLLPHGAGITYEYDARDRVIKRTDSLGQSESWTYDVMSRVTSHTDRKQQVTRYTYDTLGRSATTTYADGSTVVAGYDAGDRLRSLQDSTSGTLGWNYDDLDRIIEATSPQGTIAYDYDVLGRRISMTAAGQAAVEYRYDDASQLRKILQGTEVVEFDYDDIGRRTRLQLPNNVQAGYAYDAASQLTGLAWLKPDGSSLGTLGYAYDRSGLIVAQTGTMASQALPQPSTGNAFDDNNRQTQHQGQSLSYDNNGNLTEDGSRTYVWNARNQLAQILEGGEVIASFGYDALGRRYTKMEVGQQVDYLYDGLDAVQENVGQTVVPILTGLGIDERFARGARADRRYFIADVANSVRMGLGSSLEAVWEYDYDPYGGQQVSGDIRANSYQYAGRELDGTGLYYYRARYYDPSKAHFLTEDPIGLLAGGNVYAYVDSNPISNVDPLGLDKWIWVSPYHDNVIFRGALADPDRSGILTIYAHGGPNAMNGPSWFKKYGSALNAVEVAELIRGSTWNGKDPIWLKSCNTGKYPDGFAQQLANALGVTVYAPNAQVWFNTRGVVGPMPRIGGTGGADQSNPGQYAPFYPMSPGRR